MRNVDDLRRAKREAKLGIILSFEGAKPLAGKLENLCKVLLRPRAAGFTALVGCS